MKIELYREAALLAIGRYPGEFQIDKFDKTEKGEWIGFDNLWNSVLQVWCGVSPDKSEWGAFKAKKHLYAKEFNRIMGEEVEHLSVTDIRKREIKVVFGTFALGLLKQKYADIANGLYDDGVFLLIERELAKGETNGFYCLGNLGIYGEEEPSVQEPEKPKFLRLVGHTIDGRIFDVENVIDYGVNEQYGSLHYVCSEGGEKREGYVRYSELNIIQP